MIQHLVKGARKAVAPLRGANFFYRLTGCLRSASTTGYYLTALLAMMTVLRLRRLFELWENRKDILGIC